MARAHARHVVESWPLEKSTRAFSCRNVVSSRIGSKTILSDKVVGVLMVVFLGSGYLFVHNCVKRKHMSEFFLVRKMIQLILSIGMEAPRLWEKRLFCVKDRI